MEIKGESIGLRRITLLPCTLALQPRPGFRPAPKRLGSRLARRRPSTEASLAVRGAKWQRALLRSQSSTLLSTEVEREQTKRQTPAFSPFHQRNRTCLSVVKLPNRELRHQLLKATGRPLLETHSLQEKLEEPPFSFPPTLPPVLLHTVEVKFRPKPTRLKDPIAVLLTLVQSRKALHKPL